MITQPRTPEVRYLAPASGPWSLGRMTEVSERGIAVFEAGRCVGFVALLGAGAVDHVTIERPGVLSHTELAAPLNDPEVEGVALWSGVDAVALLAAASRLGRWHQATFMAIEKLAHDDRVLLDRWHAIAMKIVLANQAAIIRIAEALLAHGTLTGDAMLAAAYAVDDRAPPRQSEAEDSAIVTASQLEQKHVMYVLATGGIARG